MDLNNKENNEGALNGEPQQTGLNQPAQPVLEQPQQALQEPKPQRSFNRNHVLGILIAIILIALIAAILFYIKPFSLYAVSSTVPSTTTTTTMTTAPTTIYINQSKYVANSTNLLFGILNRSQYYHYINGTYPNFTLPNGISALVANFNTYGLNFTDALLTSPVEYAPGYTLKIPPKYATYTMPIIIGVFVYTEPNNQSAERFYNYEVNNVPNVTVSGYKIPFYNVSVYMANNFSTLTKPGIPNYTYATRVSEYPINLGISGANATVSYTNPFYNTTEWFNILVRYHNYLIIFNSFGVKNHFNTNTTVAIAKHYLKVMS